ncbi:MAG: galactose oxidase, partial [Planctomycetota bacterium]
WSLVSAAPLLNRVDNTVVWSGTVMIIWGGYGTSYFNDGAIYNPATDTWTAITEAPLIGRYLHNAIWTGTRMIVWGGVNDTTEFNDGAKFNP